MKVGQQFVSFLMVGGLATALQYLILIALVQLGSADVVMASSIGFAISAIFNYLLNRRMTFRSSRAHTQALPRFMVVACTGLILNALCLSLLHDQVGLHYLIAQVIATIVTLVWNFVLNRLWTFSPVSVVDNTRKDLP